MYLNIENVRKMYDCTLTRFKMMFPCSRMSWAHAEATSTSRSVNSWTPSFDQSMGVPLEWDRSPDWMSLRFWKTVQRSRFNSKNILLECAMFFARFWSTTFSWCYEEPSIRVISSKDTKQLIQKLCI